MQFEALNSHFRTRFILQTTAAISNQLGGKVLGVLVLILSPVLELLNDFVLDLHLFVFKWFKRDRFVVL